MIIIILIIVWPGSFLLSDFILNDNNYKQERFKRNSILELGSATGALAIFLRLHGLDVVTRYLVIIIIIITIIFVNFFCFKDFHV